MAGQDQQFAPSKDDARLPAASQSMPDRKVGQLHNADRDDAVRQRWPQKAATLQPLREQTGALAVMPNDLDQVAASAPKNIEITSVRIPLQALLNQTRKAWESAAHIGMAGRKPGCVAGCQDRLDQSVPGGR